MSSQMGLKLGLPQLQEWPDNFYDGFDDLTLDDVKGRPIGLDIETGGENTLDPVNPKSYLLCVSIAGSKTVFCLHKDSFKPGLKLIRAIVECEECLVVGHNIKFDLMWLAVQYGWKINCMAYDTQLAAYFLNEEDAWIKLDTLTRIHGVAKKYWWDDVDKTKLEYNINRNDLLICNGRDTHNVILLKEKYLDKLLEEEGLTQIMNVACQAVPVLTKMQARGILVDFDYAKQQQMKLYKELISLKLGLKDLAGRPFNPDSPKQLCDVLYGRFGFYAVRETEAGNPSADYESLIRLRQEQCIGEYAKPPRAIEFLDTLLKYSKLVGLNEKYYNKLPKTWVKADGCVHTNWNIGVTDTGRLSSSNPNMQSVKRGGEFRGVFIPRLGYVFLEGDFSQVELRIAAWLSQEPQMLRLFQEGVDIHTATLCEIMGWGYEDTLRLLEDYENPEYLYIKNLRVGIKNINFGEFYGATPERLQREMVKNGIYWTIEQCRHLFEEKKRLTPQAQKWKKQIQAFVCNHGYVRMPFGQLRRLPYASVMTSDGREAIRQAINFMIQSTASGWIPIIGMILLDNYFKLHPEVDGHILLNVHDSVLSEVRVRSQKAMEKLKRDVQKIMEVDVIEFVKEFFKVNITVPLEFKCDYLQRWR